MRTALTLLAIWLASNLALFVHLLALYHETENREHDR